VLAAYLRLVRAGFHRQSAYLTASLAGLFTNTVFGLLRVAVLLAVVGASGPVAGYDAATASTFVWIGQGLLAVVMMWGDGELTQKVRSGDIAVDLARPWNLQAATLAQDLGRAWHAVLLRFVPPVLFGALLLPFRWPSTPATGALFVVSVALAVVVSSATRFLVGLSAFWLLDARGVQSVYINVSTILSGLTVPIGFFPDAVRPWVYATPFPALLQTPVDVFTEHGSPWPLLAHQLAWAVALVACGQLVLAAATRKLVVQGG
jgi:ABC-2 type transport system permease protein